MPDMYNDNWNIIDNFICLERVYSHLKALFVLCIFYCTQMSNTCIQMFLKCLKWYTIPSQMCAQSYLCPIWPYNHSNLTKTPCKHNKKQLLTFHYGWLHFDFWLHACLHNHPNADWNGVFPIPIDEFYIYLFIKKRR